MAAAPWEAFIWSKMLERQKRWWVHGADGKPVRDHLSRFVPSAANPLPALNPFDKLAEREYLQSFLANNGQRIVSQPKLIACIRSPSELQSISLPQRWVLKPVGAAYSDGVFVVRDGFDVTPSARGEANCALASSKPLDIEAIVSRLNALTTHGGRDVNVFGSQRTLEWNLSCWLVEEYVSCESGAMVPIDYRCYCIGEHILWIGINHLNADGQVTETLVYASALSCPCPSIACYLPALHSSHSQPRRSNPDYKMARSWARSFACFLPCSLASATWTRNTSSRHPSTTRATSRRSVLCRSIACRQGRAAGRRWSPPPRSSVHG